MGQRDSKLTSLGVKQAHSKALTIENLSPKIDYIYTSDLGRCLQTAHIVSDTLGTMDIKIDKNLREISFGEYEGLPYDAIPPLERGYTKVPFPGGESNEIMTVRVIDAVNRIYEDNKNACVLLITHSGPIAAILASYYGRDIQEMLDNKMDHKEVIELLVSSKLKNPMHII